MVVEGALLSMISFIILFSGKQKIEPPLERCKDVRDLRLAEGRRGSAWICALVTHTLLRGSFAVIQGPDTQSG